MTRTCLVLAVLVITVEHAFAAPPASVTAPATSATAPANNAASPTEVSIRGKKGRLQAWLWRPAGPGPFPVVVYNHGSEPDPIAGTHGTVGPFFSQHGYAVLFPYRRGTGKSEGRYWGDEVD